MATFRGLYDDPPRGNIPGGNPTTTSTSSLNHGLPSGTIPNEIADAPQLATQLVHWAQTYLDNIQRQPGAQLSLLAETISTKFNTSPAGNEGEVGSLYAKTVESWSESFVASADGLPEEEVKLRQCPRIDGISTDWKWVRTNETRMLVEHKGRTVFNRFAPDIRNFAAGTSSSSFGFDSYGHASDASAILLKLGRQMIHHNCQLGVLFGGKQFILFLIVDQVRNGQIIHQMQCSPILDTAPDDGPPSLIQVTIAALLGAKDAFFKETNIRTGITVTSKEEEYPKPPMREAATKANLAFQKTQNRNGRTGGTVHTTRKISAELSHISWSYRGFPQRTFMFKRVDTSVPGGSTADVVIHDQLGYGSTGTTFNAVLQRDGQSMEVAAKFYDPDTKYMNNESEDSVPRLPNVEKELMFRNEIATYSRLADTAICPRLYGAFQGIGFTGLQTGIVLMEKLSTTFKGFSEMTEQERKVAYNHVAELHERQIHHGDVSERNFSRRAERVSKSVSGTDDDGGSIIIYDFSHSSTFESCDPGKCMELWSARRMIFESET